jgi:hypothetical protein
MCLIIFILLYQTKTEEYIYPWVQQKICILLVVTISNITSLRAHCFAKYGSTCRKSVGSYFELMACAVQLISKCIRSDFDSFVRMDKQTHEKQGHTLFDRDPGRFRETSLPVDNLLTINRRCGSRKHGLTLKTNIWVVCVSHHVWRWEP